LNKCTNAFYQSGVRVDPVSMLNIQAFQTPDGIYVGCPQMNDSLRLEKSCGPYRTAKQCIDACPSSDAKTLVVNTWSALQFLCIDRIDDWKGYSPCLSEHCIDIQGPCAPKCGSLVSILKRMVGFLEDANNQRDASQNATALDVNKISKFIGESCSRLYCFNQCSQNTTINFCGTGAFYMSEDIQWTTLSSMFFTLQQWGVNIDWPLECKTLQAHLARRL